MSHESADTFTRLVSTPVPPPDSTLAYGPDPAQVVDVWEAAPPEAGRPTPATMVVVHGGFWKAEYDRTHVAPLCVALRDAGHTVFSVEYRRIGAPGGGWPGTLEDVDASFRMITSGTGPVVLMGHSAGGHLAALVAARHPEAVWRVVSLAGVLDLHAAFDLDLGSGAAARLCGGTPAEAPQAWVHADPVRQVPTSVPFVLVHGTEDSDVPLSVSESFAEAATTAGDACDLLVLESADHFDLIDPSSSSFSHVIGACEPHEH